MFAWRLASGNYPPLTGEGARLVGGRWNSPGRPLIYASESIALCLAECLVHVTGSLPSNYPSYKHLRFRSQHPVLVVATDSQLRLSGQSS